MYFKRSHFPFHFPFVFKAKKTPHKLLSTLCQGHLDMKHFVERSVVFHSTLELPILLATFVEQR